MIKITIANVKLTYPSSLYQHKDGAIQDMLLKALGREMFPGVLSPSSCSVEPVMAGELDLTYYRAQEASDTWVRIIRSDSDSKLVRLSIEVRNSELLTRREDGVFQICKLVRQLRNFCEEFHQHHDDAKSAHFVAPSIESWTLPEELVCSIVEDELTKAKFVTDGFTTKQFIMNAPGEPFFVLLGRDPQAPGLVNEWADLRACCPINDNVKVDQARIIAISMEQYKKNTPHLGMSIGEYDLGCHIKRAQENDD